MPLVFEKKIDNGVIALWRCDETVAGLEAYCSPEDTEYASRFAADARKKEWLAWRGLIRRLAPEVTVSYNSMGAPVADRGYISVSHGGGYAAVMLCDTPCGIDIEAAGRDFSRAAGRFMSQQEKLATGNDNTLHGKIWCAKEALFKWAGEEGVDFAGEIAVDVQNMHCGIFSGVLRGRGAALHDISAGELLIIYCAG